MTAFTVMKTSIFARRFCGFATSTAVMLFAGCASTPLRQSTSEMDYTPDPPVVEAAGHILKHPVPITIVPPEHPLELRRTGLTGMVMVECSVDQTGKVTEAKVQSSSHWEFERPALEAVKQWTFQPATWDGIAFAQRVLVPVAFDLND